MVTRDPEAVFRADRIVLPGVGAFADCRRDLDALDGMVDALTEAVRDKARPFFGICVGMQLMATRGKEHVVTDGFNWIEGDVVKIQPREENLKIPHMGWNTLDMVGEHPVLERLPLGPKGRHAYFVHSYHLNAANEADVLLRADYGGPVTAMVGRDTAIGTQFHPEKSQRFGLALEAMLNAVTMPVQLGRGIRDLNTVEAWFDKGIARVIIGTAAVRDPELVKSAARKFPGRVAVGLDARDGRVAVEGWAETSQVTALEIAQRFEDAGVAAIIFTDITRDGLLKGLNLGATIALADR